MTIFLPLFGKLCKETFDLIVSLEDFISIFAEIVPDFPRCFCPIIAVICKNLQKKVSVV